MSVEDFVVSTEKTIRKFNILSFLMDIVSITLTLNILFVIFNMDKILLSINFFEVYVGHEYPVLGFNVGFAGIVLFLSAFVISLPVTAIIHLKDRKLNTVRAIEEKNSLLKDRLSAAYDNRHVSNIIVNDLSRNVADIVVKLQPATFLNMARIYQGVAFLVIISSTSVVINHYDYRTDINPPQELLDYLGNGDSSSGSDLVIMEQTTNNSDNTKENLTGKTAIVVVEGKQVDLTLPPGSGTGFIQGDQANNTPEDFKPSSAYDISVMSSSIYSEELPEGYESIIRQYFEEMAGK